MKSKLFIVQILKGKTDDPSAYKASINFWCSHALAYDPEVMDEPFETTWGDIISDGEM